MPGGKFLKGNHYFKGDDPKAAAASGEDRSSEEPEPQEDKDEWAKLM